MANGEAGMYIMGNFVVDGYANVAGSRNNLGFFQFPKIPTTILGTEDAPLVPSILPRNANSKIAAHTFLSFVSGPAVQSEWNEILGQIPSHTGAVLTDNGFILDTAATVNTATALSQFFDRDAPASMAEPAFRAFQEFMLDTTKLDSILIRLHEVRDTAY